MSSTRTPQVALITGCSSGIGEAAAIRLHETGALVYATARRIDTLVGLEARGIRTLSLDVTDEASMAAAVAAVEEQHGSIDILVNNAGYGLYGPVEQVSLEDVRRQFETNVFGLSRLIQLVLPGMRRAGGGRILNVSSMGGRTTLPGGAFYHASKYAVEALSDLLRIEVAPFGIDVVLIEPGPVKTPWNETALSSVPTAAVAPNGTNGAAVGTPTDDPYAGYKAAVATGFAKANSGSLARFGSTADDIAKVITRAATIRRPRTRYLINAIAKSSVALRRLLPDRAYDFALRQQYGLSR